MGKGSEMQSSAGYATAVPRIIPVSSSGILIQTKKARWSLKKNILLYVFCFTAFVLFANAAQSQVLSYDTTYAVFFSEEQGIKTSAISVTITTDCPSGVIKYTTNYSNPTMSSTTYTGAIPINSTTVIRAAVFWNTVHSRIVTKNYLYGFPTDIPIISLVTDSGNLWDPDSGIYCLLYGDAANDSTINNSMLHGSAWERACNVTLFEPGNTVGFSENAGVRIHGGASRWKSPKKSFRLYFREDYGSTKLRYQVFPDMTLAKFDKLVLKAGFSDAWSYPPFDALMEERNRRSIYIRDAVERELYRNMGELSAHSRFALLYLNTTLWGVYNIAERMDEEFFSDHYNYPAWDINNQGEIVSGDMTALNQLITYTNKQLTANDYASLSNLLDISLFCKYMTLNIFLQNWDWPNNNWVVARERDTLGVTGGKFRFLPWDGEYTLGQTWWEWPPVSEYWRIDDAYMTSILNVQPTVVGGIPVWQNRINPPASFTTEAGIQANLIRGLFNSLLSYEPFQNHFYYAWKQAVHYGALQIDSIKAVLTKNKAEFLPFASYEIDRWKPGDQAAVLRDLDTTFMLTDTFLATRKVVGPIWLNRMLTKINRNKDMAWELVLRNQSWKYNDAHQPLAVTWKTDPAFDVSWNTGTAPLGFGEWSVNTTNTLNSSGYTLYFRKKFTFPDSASLVDWLRFDIRYDDGIAVYLNGGEVLRDNLSPTAGNDSPSLISRENDTYTLFYVPDTNHLLVQGENILAVELHNSSLSSSDAVFDMIFSVIGSDKGVDKVDDVPGVASRDMLEVYPNPFNPTTTITITNSKLRITNVKIYSIKGEMVCDVTQNNRNSQFVIRNSFVWDASGMPSGIYIVRAKIGNTTLVKQMTLLK